MRTTIDLDVPVLRELKRLQRQEGKSLGRLVSDLVAKALAERKSLSKSRKALTWISRPMRARVNLADKDAVHAILNRPTGDAEPASGS